MLPSEKRKLYILFYYFPVMPTVSRKSAVQQLLAKCKGMKTLIKETSIPVNQGGVNYKSEDIVHYFINVFSNNAKSRRVCSIIIAVISINELSQKVINVR